MRITIDITDAKAEALLAFLRSLDFVKVEEDETSIVLPDWQFPVLDARLNEYYSNPDRVKDFKANLLSIREKL